MTGGIKKRRRMRDKDECGVNEEGIKRKTRMNEEGIQEERMCKDI